MTWVACTVSVAVARGAAHSSSNVKYYWRLTEIWQECFACSSAENRATAKKNCKPVAPHLQRSFIADIEKVTAVDFDDEHSDDAS